MYPESVLFKFLTVYCISGFLILGLDVTELRSELLTRTEAIKIALEKNPEVTAARKDWEIARARLTQARALPDPELKLEYEELPGVSRFGKFGERNIGLTQRVEFPVKWWLRNRAASRGADAVRMAVFETTKLEVATRVKITYDRVLMGQKVLEYTEKNLQLAQDLLHKANVRFEAGDVPQLEVLRAEVETGRAENRVTMARNGLSVSRAELNTLLAREIHTPLEVTDDFSYLPIEVDLEKLIDLALEHRPDLLGAGLKVAAAHSNQSAAVSSIMPDLNIGVFRQRIRGDVDNGNFWHVVLGIDVPIWAMFRQRGEIAQASAETARAAAEENALRYQVLLEVKSAFLDLKSTEDQVQLFQNRILREAKRAHEVASMSYQEGKASYLELLEAQRALTETSVEYAQALFNHRSALAALERAVGGNLPE